MTDELKNLWPKWEVCRFIGAGSFGRVYEIVRKEYGVEEHSALKVISIPQSDSEVQSLKNDGMSDKETTEYYKGVVQDFVQEIQLMAKLKGNSNIVAYEDFSVNEKEDSIGFEIMIRMEMLTGLPAYLRENRFRVSDVIRLGIDMCKALEVCREMNIVHRDIKPDNIFVSAAGSYKLGDFGVARTIEKTMAGLSRKGTLSYMAPEIYKGNEYGFESDIYSLGVVLYKLLNDNRDPFLPAYPAPVQYNDMTEAFSKRIQGLEMPVPTHADEKLAKIVFKACAADPADRYSHPRDFRCALEGIISDYSDETGEYFPESSINYYTNDSVFSERSENAPDNEASLVSPETPGEKEEEAAPAYATGTTVLVDSALVNAPESASGSVPSSASQSAPGSAVRSVPQSASQSASQSAPGSAVRSVPQSASQSAPGSAVRSVPPSAFQSAPERAGTGQAPEKVLCPVCGSVIKDGYKFCSRCGFKVMADPAKITVCPTCGRPIKQGSKFCGKCGRRLT